MTTTEHDAIDLSGRTGGGPRQPRVASLTSRAPGSPRGPASLGDSTPMWRASSASSDGRSVRGPTCGDSSGQRALVMLVRRWRIEPPADWRRVGGGFGHQMILDRLVARAGHRRQDPTADRASTAADVPQMLALVELTQPGPFRPRTIELGHYFGVFEDGRAHRDGGGAAANTRVHRGQRRLHPPERPRPRSRRRAQPPRRTGILARGQTPILHVAQANVGARRVYERLGFIVRRELEFVAVETPAKHPTPDADCDEPGIDAS